MSRLTVKNVKCIRPASGIDDTARTVFGVIGGAVGAGASIAGATVTGGALAATVGLATIAGAGGGVKVIEVLDHFFSGADDLYIKVNGNKVWPSDKYRGIDAQESIDLNLTFDFSGKVTVELWEYDYIGSDDKLGYISFDVKNMTAPSLEDKFLVANEGEGSIYELDLSIVK